MLRMHPATSDIGLPCGPSLDNQSDLDQWCERPPTTALEDRPRLRAKPWHCCAEGSEGGRRQESESLRKNVLIRPDTAVEFHNEGNESKAQHGTGWSSHRFNI